MIHIFAAQQSTEAEATGIAAFGLDIKSFIFQLITFTIVVLFLKFFVFNKFFKVIDERKDEIKSGIQNAQESEKILLKTKQEYKRLIDSANNEASKIIDEARVEAAKILKEIENTATKRSEKIISEAQLSIDSEILKAQKELKKENAKLVSSLTARIIREKMNDEIDKKIIESALR